MTYETFFLTERTTEKNGQLAKITFTQWSEIMYFSVLYESSVLRCTPYDPWKHLEMSSSNASQSCA